MRFRRLFDIAASVLRNPRASAIYFASLPEAMRGLDLGQHWPDQPRQPPSASGLEGHNSSIDRSSNPLVSYVDGVTTGHGLWKWRHYLDMYHRHLSKFVGRQVEILEIGVYSGGSLEMWKHYFGPACHVSGVDVEPACKAYESASTAIYIGDQGDRTFWRDVRTRVPRVDVVIDDGGHQPHQQMVTLEELLPHLRPGGVYICEDVHGVSNRFASFACSLAHSLNAFIPDMSRDQLTAIPTRFQSDVSSIHVYPFAIVIEKANSAVPSFEAPKRGTDWQPFLEDA